MRLPQPPQRRSASAFWGDILRAGAAGLRRLSLPAGKAGEVGHNGRFDEDAAQSQTLAPARSRRPKPWWLVLALILFLTLSMPGQCAEPMAAHHGHGRPCRRRRWQLASSWGRGGQMPQQARLGERERGRSIGGIAPADRRHAKRVHVEQVRHTLTGGGWQGQREADAVRQSSDDVSCQRRGLDARFPRNGAP